jgi:hypothetical protein
VSLLQKVVIVFDLAKNCYVCGRRTVWEPRRRGRSALKAVTRRQVRTQLNEKTKVKTRLNEKTKCVLLCFACVWNGDSARLIVITSCKRSIHPITNPNPVYSHSYIWQYVHVSWVRERNIPQVEYGEREKNDNIRIHTRTQKQLAYEKHIRIFIYHNRQLHKLGINDWKMSHIFMNACFIAHVRWCTPRLTSCVEGPAVGSLFIRSAYQTVLLASNWDLGISLCSKNMMIKVIKTLLHIRIH